MHHDQSGFESGIGETENFPEEMMASHLPPRSEYHRKTKRNRRAKHRQKKRNRENYPFITIFAYIFLLLPIIIGAYFFIKELNNDPVPVDKDPNFDRVEIDGNSK